MSVGKKKPAKGAFNGAFNGALKGRDEVFDASPDAGDKVDSPSKVKGKAAGFFQKYTNTLKASFDDMNSDEQEALITRFCYVISIGIAMVALSCFYTILPPLVRILALPIVLAAAWFVGSKVVAPAMIERFRK
ncbi:MAG: hypothetical protein K2Y32_00780 [Candidatus Obscuribacterales bacterium]|nr:hypothetical protein [Candidatus Obscuribacterales bacterium]